MWINGLIVGEGVYQLESTEPNFIHILHPRPPPLSPPSSYRTSTPLVTALPPTTHHPPRSVVHLEGDGGVVSAKWGDAGGAEGGFGLVASWPREAFDDFLDMVADEVDGVGGGVSAGASVYGCVSTGERDDVCVCQCGAGGAWPGRAGLQQSQNSASAKLVLGISNFPAVRDDGRHTTLTKPPQTGHMPLSSLHRQRHTYHSPCMLTSANTRSDPFETDTDPTPTP